MKKMKKVFAVVLAMAMILGMSVMTFAGSVDSSQLTPATPTSKIVVENVPENATIQWEKIVEAAPKTSLGWSLVSGVSLSNDITLDQLINSVDKENPVNNNAENGKINTNEIVAKAIEGITLNNTLESGHEIPAVTPGLYVIEVEKEGYTFTRMLAYVAWNEARTAAVSETIVSAKGAEDQVQKEITANMDGESYKSVSAGDVVPYTVSVSYPYFAQTATDKTFMITDTVTGGTIVKGSVVINIGSGDDSVTSLPVTAAPKYSNENKTMTINLGGDSYNNEWAGKTVTVTYNVLVGEGSILSNKVESTSGTKKTQAVVISPKVNAEILKKDKDDEKVLAGATFTLYQKVTEKDDATKAIVNNKVVDIPEDTGNNVDLVKEIGSAVTDASGKAKFMELDAEKVYWVVETVAPNGYSLNDTASKLSISEDNKAKEGTAILVTNTEDPYYTAGVSTMKTVNTAGDFNQTEIKDTKLSALPSTGGIGTTVFTIGGCAIIVVAAGLFFVSRRKKSA